MKPAATYLYRPIAVQAIQLPPAGEDPTDEFITSLHELLGGIDWESGKNGTLAILFPDQDPIIANPGDWIVRDDGNPPYCEPVGVIGAEDFERRFMPAVLSDEFRALEAERVRHLTTP